MYKLQTLGSFDGPFVRNVTVIMGKHKIGHPDFACNSFQHLTVTY